MGSKISPTLLDDLEKLKESKGCMYGCTEGDNSSHEAFRLVRVNTFCVKSGEKSLLWSHSAVAKE